MIEVEVTAEDIRHGLRLSAKCCPVARAIRRQLKLREGQVGVTHTFARVQETYYHLDYQVVRFISKFDNCQDVEPFTFLLRGKLCTSG